MNENKPLTNFMAAKVITAYAMKGGKDHYEWKYSHDDVRSAVEGMREVILKEHNHFKGNSNKYMADYTEQALLNIDYWFPTFAKEEKKQ